VLDRLHARGLVTREREGKMFRYAPRRKREVVERARVGAALAQILNPEVRPAIATLVDAVESLDPSCWTSSRVRSRRAGSHAMDRDLVLTGLVIATVGTTVLLAGAWPQRIEPPVSARTWERISWRGLWRPMLPAVLVTSILIGVDRLVTNSCAWAPPVRAPKKGLQGAIRCFVPAPRLSRGSCGSSASNY
jgi:hypothetical protein